MSTYSQENIRDIHAEKYRIANGGEVDKIAPPVESRDSFEGLHIFDTPRGVPNQPECHNMVEYELCIVFAGLLELQAKNKKLLGPVRRV